MNKKYPLFANEFMTQEIEKRSRYYLEGRDDRRDADYNAVMAEEAERLERLMANAGKLIVY